MAKVDAGVVVLGGMEVRLGLNEAVPGLMSIYGEHLY